MSIITKTKTFFKSKPIRIIIALCVIAAIMVAVGIGISALVKKITDKCANQPGTDWNSTLNMCVPRGCDDGGPVCKSKSASDDKSGKCIPTNYCNYIDKDGNNYQYIDEYCACTISCLEGEPVDPKTGLNHTNMHLSDSGSGYEPNNPLSCKTKCKFNPIEKGGYGYCDPDDECKVSISKYYDEKILTDAGCLSSFSYIKQPQVCNNDTNVVCEQGECSDTEQPFKIDDTSTYPNFPKDTTFTSYCNNFKTCKDDSKIVACTQDTDCSIGTRTSGKCNPNDTLKKKGFEYVGECSNSDQIINVDNYCLSEDKIGENKFKGDKSRETLIHKINNDKVGISLNQPQCNTTNKAECKNSDIMNNWFCDTNKQNSCQYFKDDKIQSCDETPPNTKENSSATAFCCPKDNIATKGSNPTSFCCPIKTRNGYCLNTSKYKPDPSWLGMNNENINFSCSNDEDCKEFDIKLKSTLSGSEDSNDEKYVGSFCDNQICKFFAGYVESLEEEDGKYSNNYYFIGNDETTNTSQAVKVDNDITFSLPMPSEPNPANLTMCKPAGSSTNHYFGIYDNNLKPVSNQSTSEYTTKETLMAQSRTRPVTLTDCMNYNNKTSGEFSVDSASIAENASGANYDSNQMSISEGSCTYDILCNKASSTVCIDKQNSKKLNINNGNDSCDKGSPQSLPWKFSLDKIGGKLYDSEGNPKYFVRKPKGSNDIKVKNCSDIYISANNNNDCNDIISLPEELYNYKNYFKSPCAIINGNCQDSLSLPEYNFETGTYCDKGFKFNNRELNCDSDNDSEF